MTRIEFISLWKRINIYSLSDLERLRAEVEHACETSLEIEAAGLTLKWKELPEYYRNNVVALLCISLCGGNVKKGLERMLSKEPEGGGEG